MVVAFVSAAFAAHAAPQEGNSYTRYELLAEGSGAFRIVYDITAVRPGATEFFNPTREGSIGSNESVTGLATGAPLRFEAGDGEHNGGWEDAAGLPHPRTDEVEVLITARRASP